MNRSKQPIIRNFIQEAWTIPGQYLAGMIGRPGYTLPSLQGLVWHDLSLHCVEENLKVRAAGSGDNNWLAIPEGHKWPGATVLSLTPHARNNVVIIGAKSNVYGRIQLRGSGNLLIFGEGINQASQINTWFWGNDGLVFWGKGSTSNGTTINIQGQHGFIIIGDDCMFAKDINVRDGDNHSIIDMSSGTWENRPANVLIEPHVWVAESAWIMKGSKIGFGSIIGGKSFASGVFPRYSLIAGVPAKVLRRGASWDRMSIPRANTVADLRDFEQSLD